MYKSLRLSFKRKMFLKDTEKKVIYLLQGNEIVKLSAPRKCSLYAKLERIGIVGSVSKSFPEQLKAIVGE